MSNIKVYNKSNSFIDMFDDMDKLLSNSMIGFKDFFQPTFDIIKLNSANNSNFPPYNIYIAPSSNQDRLSKDVEYSSYIELACAGISKDNLEVSLTPDNILTVRTTFDGIAEPEEIQYIHKGIATRYFEFSRTIQPNMKIEKVSYINGILKIELSNLKKSTDKTKIFTIE